MTIFLVPTLQQDQPSAIPGAPGRDYPDFTKVPRTSFTCDGLSPGFYADPEGECQVYHHCTHGSNKPSFTRLCPIGTLYNQQYFTCDWWFNVDCSVVSRWAGCQHSTGGRPLLLERCFQRGPGDLRGQDGPGVGQGGRVLSGVTDACTCASF